MSVKPRNFEIIKCLCAYEADIDDILVNAARAGEWDDVLLIMTYVDDAVELASKLLFVAIKQNLPEKVKILLERGASLRYTKGEITPGVYAASRESWDCFRALLPLYKGEPLSKDYNSVLAIAAGKENWEVVNELIAMHPRNYPPYAIYQNKSAQQWLVTHKKLGILEDLLHVDGRIESEVATSPLQTALDLNDLDAIKLLLSNGASAEEILENAVKKEAWAHIALILDNAKIDYSCIINRLLYEIISSCPEEVLAGLLIREGVSIDIALKKAVDARNDGAIATLLDAAPDYKNPSLLTPLFGRYIDRDEPLMIRRIMQHGANANTNLPHIKHHDKPALYAAQRWRWVCLNEMASSQNLHPIESDLGNALLIAAQEDQWTIVAELSLRKPKFDCDSHSGKCAGHYAIAAGKIDVLATMLESGLPNYSVGYTQSLLDYAESTKCAAAVATLEKYGANHDSNILNAARRGSWDRTRELITLHYFTQPNCNETKSDLKIITGKLLPIAMEGAYLHFLELLKYEPDLTQTLDGRDLLAEASLRSNWKCLEDLLRIPTITTLFTQSQIQNALINCLKNRAPHEIVERITEMVKDIDNTIEKETGNSLLHLAVMSDKVKNVQLFARLQKRKGCLNRLKQTPLSLSRSDEISIAIIGNDEWVQAKKFESQNESVIDKQVIASRERSLKRLAARYPNVDVAACHREYREFIKTLPRNPNNSCLVSGDHWTSDREVARALALTWMAAKDETALPGVALSSLPTKKDITNYVNLRKISLAENHHEAKERGTCDRGTCTRIVEALNHAHPDIAITYAGPHIVLEAREVIMYKIFNQAPNILSSCTTAEQRGYAKDYHYNPENIPTFMTLLSTKLRVELKSEFGDYITEKQLDEVLAPAGLAYINFILPETFTKLATLIDEVKDYIDKCERFSIISREDMDYLSSLVEHAYDNNGRTLTQEYNLIKKAFDASVDLRCGVTVNNRVTLFGLPKLQPEKTLSDKLMEAGSYISQFLSGR